MTASFLERVLGTRKGRKRVANVADGDSRMSSEISWRMLELLRLTGVAPAEGQRAGTALETEVARDLEPRLRELDPNRRWVVEHGRRKLSDFEQYDHIAELERLIRADETGTLSIAIGRHYEIKPDVTVALKRPGGFLFLHASISCKLTVRSDRVQNIRHEATILTLQRRGRTPHIVAVTAEPLPSRLASIGRGTGAIDALYHVALPELIQSVQEVGNEEQEEVLTELINQDRLFDYEALAPTLLL